ncbi:MAG: PKD domain-containing protein [Bacteroidota bacterium]
MKSTNYFILVIVISFFTNTLHAQPWNAFLPKDKVVTNELSFFDLQKAFNDYWAPKDVIDGYYLVDGEKVKAGGWKQFKRWEWYWENRVNPVTGAFPNTSAWEEYQKIKESYSNQRSPTGQWTSMGPNNSTGGYAGLGRLNRIGFHPTDNNILYAGAAAGGIWKSTDGGSTWIPQGDDMAAIGISDIVVIPTAGDDIVYVATGDKDHSDTYSVGVLKSTDGGATWANTGLVFTAVQKQLINRLLVDPLNNNIFYAATTLGVYKSTDSGDNWSVVTSTEYIDLEFKPGATNVLYGSTWQGDVYRSTDSGVNWSPTLSTSGKRTELAISPNNSSFVYAMVANSNSGLFGIYKSTDSGSSFSVVYNGINLLAWSCSGGDSGGQAWYDLCLAADPNDENIVYLGGVNTWKSTDGGSSWNINNHWSSNCGGSAVNVHADKHDLAFQNGSSTLFECNDGGLYSTSDGGSSWTHLTNGMTISQMYRLGVAQTTSADVITGLQDNGTKAMLTSTWNDVIGGDGMECLIDYSNENTQYGSLYYGSIHRTTDHWASSTNISGSISGNAAWVTPYVQDPNNSNTLFVGYDEVWKSTNQGNSWTKLSNWGGNTLRSLVIAPSNSSYIYTATTGTIYSSSNGGLNWTNITGSLPTWASNITYISVKNDDPSTLWVSMGEFNNYGVFESTDGGANWTDISSGLPVLPTNCVVQNKQNTTEVELYAATDVGVYLKLGNANWTPFFDNMPNVVVTELDIYYDDVTTSNSMIRASTFGRGLWESDLYSVLSPPPIANFDGVPTNGIAPLLVAFTDLSIDSVNTWNWEFGDGGVSTDQNPSYEYISPGSYSVTLIVGGPGGSDTLENTNYIVVNYPTPISDFEGLPTLGIAPLLVAFTDLSVDSVNTWLWEFGDGNVSTDQNPDHTYINPGDYTVKLIATGPGGSDTLSKTDYIIVTYPTPTADFDGSPTSGNTPFIVTFTDLSIDSVNTWLWDFGDGGSSTIQHPVYTYVAAGTYDVQLIVTGPGGSDTISKINYIFVTEAEPEANFIGDPTIGEAPLEVSFMDLSIGNIDAWSWDFGDGELSSEQNPSHEYITSGNFTVSLTVTGSGGSDTEIKTDYILIPVGTSENPSSIITVYPNPVTNNLHIIFPDLKKREIELKNIDGKIVIQAVSFKKHEVLDLHELSQGVYALIINVDGETASVIKVVKK